MTEALYSLDSYLREFDADVVDVDGQAVQLDRTAFYPTGGGQPHDEGLLTSGENSWKVVLKDDGKLQWVIEQNGVMTAETDDEPMTTAARRAEAKALGIVPDDSQL